MSRSENRSDATIVESKHRKNTEEANDFFLLINIIIHFVVGIGEDHGLHADAFVELLVVVVVAAARSAMTSQFRGRKIKIFSYSNGRSIGRKPGRSFTCA